MKFGDDIANNAKIKYQPQPLQATLASDTDISAPYHQAARLLSLSNPTYIKDMVFYADELLYVLLYFIVLYSNPS